MFSYMKLFFCGAKETPVRKSVKGYRSSFFTKQNYAAQLEGNVGWFFSYIQSFIKSYYFLV